MINVEITQTANIVSVSENNIDIVITNPPAQVITFENRILAGSRIRLVTIAPTVIVNNRVSLAIQPLGDMLFNMAFVRDTANSNTIEEHSNVITEGSSALFSDAAGELDGKYAVVSYIGIPSA